MQASKSECIEPKNLLTTKPVSLCAARTATRARSPDELLSVVQGIELELGRNRQKEAEEKAASGGTYCNREIDIDILFYDDVIIVSPELTIPHPLLHKRDFVLAPLCEIMRDYTHPVLGKTIGQLREELLAQEQDK